MPLYAVIARENFPLRMMGTVIGGTAMAGSLGMAPGPLVGGLIYDHFGSYGWLYVGSWGMGLTAMLILMAFRPFPRKSPRWRSRSTARRTKNSDGRNGSPPAIGPADQCATASP